MDFSPSLNAKGFFRFTGPPEHWLTAIKFMTWGLEKKYLHRWKEIQTGDVFFIHSTGAPRSLFRNAKSGIIGIGVVGSHFSQKNNYLWVGEVKEQMNRWPLLVPLSEIYLFSEIPSPAKWDNPDLSNINETQPLVDLLLKNRIPIKAIKGFPPMGSFSAVSSEVADQIIYDHKPLYAHKADTVDNIISSKPTKLEKIESATETLRYADTLEFVGSIKSRIVRETAGTYTKNNELLARAETTHATVLQQLIDLFRSKGYDTRSNKFVDLFAYNEDRSFLFEVKSTENKNFRSQARKGLIQLFEYDHFEIKKFVADNQYQFDDKFKILTLSQTPNDENYVNFINTLDTGVSVIDNGLLKAVGDDSGFTRL